MCVQERFEHFSRQMGLDFYDLVEWAAEQDWCDGNVGSNGVSYLCLTQWLGAVENPPHIKAVIPWEGFSDPYREHAFHGGIPDTGFFRNLWSRRANKETGFINKNAEYEDFVREQAEHPFRDAFWKSKHPDLTKISCPAYVVARWAPVGLHSRGTIEAFKQMSSKDKWLEAHGRKEWETYYAREGLDRQKRFFDHFLKGQQNSFEQLPRVRYEVREQSYEGRFRFATDFPIPGTDRRAYYLSENGVLAPEAQSAASCVSSGTAIP